MRKGIIWLLVLILTASLLSACAGSTESTPAVTEQQAAEENTETNAEPEPAEEPAPAEASEAVPPPEEAAQPEEAPVREGYPIDGKYFTLWLPEEWDGQVVTEESQSDELYALAVYHKASHEANEAGLLFSLELEDSMGFLTLPSYRVVGVLSDGTVNRNLVALMPTDVQAAEGFFDEYASLYDEDVFAQIFSDIEPADGWTLREMTADELYEAQSHYAFWNAMYIVYATNALPSGIEVVPEGWDSTMEDNHFAVLDVDGDGRDELLISVDDSYMAGMITEIYRLGEDGYSLQEELSVFPSVIYYTGGLVQAYASHNYTYGDFSPYTLYRYQPEDMVYEEIASVYGWNRAFSETDYNGASFPSDVDADGNGSVLCVSDADGERWLDDDEYERWESQQFSDAEAIEIPWLSITPEHIDTIWG